MRVVAGVAGGRRLQVPPGRKLRPTSERVREAVFSSLGSMGAIHGARVLDLFAGTGALGIEALSRGAAAVTFVEADPAAVRVIRANLAGIGLGGATVVQSDVARFLESPGPGVDLAFADPPYAFDDWSSVLAHLRANLAVLEARRPIDPGPRWSVARSARYGDTAVTMIRRLPVDVATPRGERRPE